MKIYTGTGDDGTTGLFGGSRLSKDDVRVEAYGTIDEVNAALGVARASGASDRVDRIVETVQRHLFTIGAEIASGSNAQEKLGIDLVGAEEISFLEGAIDQAEEDLPPLRAFILPGGSAIAAAFHMARTVARRAERALVSLHRTQPLRPDLIVYINRLSDLLFVLARLANIEAGQQDVPWAPHAREPKD